MRVNVQTLSGQKTEVSVAESESVEQFRIRIAQRYQVGVDRVRLIFNGIHMTDNRQTIAAYGVFDGSTVQMVVDQQRTINVHIDLPDGTSRSVSVEPSEQIAMLKQKLHENFRYSIEYMELFFEGRHIKEGRLSHHNIAEGSKLQLRLKKINVTIRKMDGKNLSMEVSHVETVAQLKNRLHRETGVVASQQRLLHNSTELSTGKLADYGIRCGSIIQMVGRLRGG